ncbi:MAG: hypothetical protein KC777_15370 [Cyanobacteria bacterium HKST-UBA02]|nr:hypothetical protein [Cyanobacteria bacterium HKST-UBA02]
MDISHQRPSDNFEDRGFGSCAGVDVDFSSDAAGDLSRECISLMSEVRQYEKGDQAIDLWTRQNRMSLGDRMAQIGSNIGRAYDSVSSGKRDILEITFDDIFGDQPIAGSRSLAEQNEVMRSFIQRRTADPDPNRFADKLKIS